MEKATPINSKAVPENGQTIIAGRVQQVKTLDRGGYVTELTQPAADEYSHPSTVEIFSDQRLGNQGDEIQQLCAVGGYANNFRYTDRQTGQPRQGRKIILTLRAVQ